MTSLWINKIVNKSLLWILLLTTVSFYPRRIEASFDEKIEEDSVSGNRIKESMEQTVENVLTQEDENFPKFEESVKKSGYSLDESVGKIEEESKDEKMLPDIFSQSARQFYQFYSKKYSEDVKETVENMENKEETDHEEHEYQIWFDTQEENEYEEILMNETTDFSINQPPHILWRNIIDAPDSGCPPGQRKDRNGRCRISLYV